MVDQTISIAESLYHEDLYRIPGKVLIVLAKDWQQVTDEERSVLSKMLAALKLSLASVQIITRQQFSLDDIVSLSPSRVLAFGIKPAEVSNLYELTEVNGIALIAAEPIDKLDDARKKTLWVELRKMFGV